MSLCQNYLLYHTVLKPHFDRLLFHNLGFVLCRVGITFRMTFMLFVDYFNPFLRQFRLLSAFSSVGMSILKVLAHEINSFFSSSLQLNVTVFSSNRFTHRSLSLTFL